MAVLGLVALVAAACGGDDDASDTTAASPSTAAATTVATTDTTTATETTAAAPGTTGQPAEPSGEPYKIGIPTRLSGPGSVAYIGAPIAAEAWQEWVNANGGINGHPVEVIVEDSAADAAKGLTIVKDMVENQGVVALHPQDPSIDNGMLEYAKETGIAVISPYAAYPIWNETANWFALGIQSFPDSQRAGLAITEDAGKQSIAAVVCAEVAACGAVDESMSNLAPSTGVRYDGVFKVAAASPNYTAECLALKDKGTEVLYMGVSVDVARKVVSDCATQGYEPFFFVPYHAFNPQWAEIEGAQALAMLPTIPWFADTPATADFRAAMEEYGDLSKADETSMYVWGALEAFREAATAANLGESPSLQEVTDAFYALETNLNGFIPDVSFTPGEPSPKVNCYFVAGLEDGEFTMPQGKAAQCLE